MLAIDAMPLLMLLLMRIWRFSRRLLRCRLMLSYIVDTYTFTLIPRARVYAP